MKLKTTLLATILLLLPAMTALAQNDGGAPDSLIMEFTPPVAGANDSTFQLQLYMFNDVDDIASMSGGFSWDNTNAIMDTALWSPQADAAFNFIKFLFFSGDIVQTNIEKKFQAAGSRIFGNGITSSPTRKLIATYDFTVTNWTVNSVVIIDTNVFSGGTNLKFVNTSNKGYIPYWNGPIEIRDPNAPTNDPPILDSIGAKSVDQGVNLNFAVTATDADLNPLTLTATPLPSGATFTDNGDGTGLFNWTPDVVQIGTFDIKFMVSDGTVSDSEIVTITVNDVNRPPVLDPIGPKSTDAGVALSFNVTASDPDGGAFLVARQLPAGATFTSVNITTSSFDWTPTSNQVGDHLVTFFATDGLLGDTEIVTITVNPPPNQPPVLATIGAQSTIENVQLTFAVTASDPEGATPTLSSGSLPMGASFVDNGDGTGAFDWTPSFSQAGSYQVTFTASDGLLADSEAVTITVIDGGNQAPVIAAIGPKSVDENIPLQFNISASDPDGTVPGLSLLSRPSGATFVDNGNGTGTFNWTPDFTQAGLHNVTFFATDGFTKDSEVVAITVNDVNRRPVINTIPDQSIVTGNQLLFTVTASDPDGTTPSLSADPLPAGATFTDNADGSGSFDWTPGVSQTGSFNVTFFAQDTQGGFDSTVANIVVLRPPSADSVWVGTTPAVPGASVSVPISFNNSCSLEAAFLAVTYDSVYLHLDSVSFSNGALAAWNNLADISIPGWITITSGNDTAPSIPQSSGSLWADLHFTSTCETPAGIYPIDLNRIISRPPIEFTRNCGAGVSTEIPEFFAGSIISDTSANFVCGYVVRPDGTEIVGATVELHGDFPNSTAIQTITSSGIGSWSFSDFTTIPFDVYAYAEGYYPANVQDLNFGQRGVRIVLEPLPSLTTTSQWVDYYCDVNTYFGAPLPVGSVVEARTPANLLVGQFIVTLAGQYGFMPVYRASAQFNDPGAVADDVISFFINGKKAIATGDVIYPTSANDFARIQVCLEGGAVVTKTCDLLEGWNLVSWNIDTQSDAILDVLGSQMSCIEVVLGFETGGLTYDPMLPDFSTLANVDHLSGYWIKVKTGCTVSLAIEGVPVPATTPIPVSAGWNLVSYLPELNLTPTVGFASLGADLLYAYGYDNGIVIYQPGANNFNTLTDLTTCNGYWIKMNASGTLAYPGGGGAAVSGQFAYSGTTSALASSAITANPMATPNWVNLYAENLNFDGKTVREGTVITANSTSSNKTIGNFTMTRDGKFGFMPVYASVDENDKNAFKPGDDFYLSVDGVKTDEQFTWSANGESIEVLSLSSTSGGGNGLPENYSLRQNYPNPFNPSTVISFSLPSAGQARVEIYNLLGELIAVPFDGQAQVGENQIEWNGRDRAGRTVASGVYFYRLTSGSFTEARKMMLLK